MKKLTFKSMLDNLRSSVAGVADAVTGANKFDYDPDENVRAHDFAFSEVRFSCLIIPTNTVGKIAS